MFEISGKIIDSNAVINIFVNITILNNSDQNSLHVSVQCR